nr:signal recognition particle receptor subunit beta isoform X1 [Hydra vulgaris]XP_047132781.1 signal recognition particle receptor subunit beta isoform X1 [Hydra vulgaris]
MDIHFLQPFQNIFDSSANIYFAIFVTLVAISNANNIKLIQGRDLNQKLFVYIVSGFFFILRRKAGDTVLLLGLCDSGKTLMFSWLVANKSISTQTSIIENKGTYIANKSGKTWQVVDLPGHERVRAKFLYKHKDGARGIIFVIDSVNFPRELRDVAEFLYDVLANRTMQKNKVSILIACNKQDMPTAKSSQVIKLQLEKELTTLRQTRSAALLGIDDYSSSKNAFIGKQGKDFEFAHVNPIKVQFCECNLKNENSEETLYDQVENWMNSL